MPNVIQRNTVTDDEIIALFILGCSVKRITDYVKENEKYSKELARAKVEKAIINYLKEKRNENADQN